MSNIFTAVKSALPVIHSVTTRAILLFGLSALQAQLRHGRELQR